MKIEPCKIDLSMLEMDVDLVDLNKHLKPQPPKMGNYKIDLSRHLFDRGGRVGEILDVFESYGMHVSSERRNTAIDEAVYLYTHRNYNYWGWSKAPDIEDYFFENHKEISYTDFMEMYGENWKQSNPLDDIRKMHGMIEESFKIPDHTCTGGEEAGVVRSGVDLNASNQCTLDENPNDQMINDDNRPLSKREMAYAHKILQQHLTNPVHCKPIPTLNVSDDVMPSGSHRFGQLRVLR